MEGREDREETGKGRIELVTLKLNKLGKVYSRLCLQGMKGEIDGSSGSVTIRHGV